MAAEAARSQAPCACLRCREQKLRCSRDLPICTRCDRLKATCVFPKPPDRKQIARNRARPGTRKLDKQSVHHGRDRSTTSQATTPASIGTSVGSPAYLPQYIEPADNTLYQSSGLHSANTSNDFVLVANSDPPHTLIPQSLRNLLEDIYFSYGVNPTLTLHRSRFTEGQVDGRQPRFLALALYSFSANYLSPPCKLVEHYDLGSEVLKDANIQARSWAETAGRECLQSIGSPTLAHLQTCLLLSFYWFSQNETPRFSMFSGMAYRLSRMFLLEANDTEVTDWTEFEMKRRCFWAAFSSNCVISDHYIIGTSKDSLTLKIPLPSTDASFLHMVQDPAVTLTDIETSKPFRQRGDEPNVMANLMRLLLHWTKVRDHIELSHRGVLDNPVVQFLQLDEWTLDFLENLDISLTYTKERLQIHAIERNSMVIFLIHTIYHQIKMVLHASIVPQFSGQDIPKSIPRNMIKTSAQVVLESAKAMSSLATDLLSLGIDAARLPPFHGHGMYIAATIHMLFLGRPDEKGVQAWNDIVPLLRVLKRMKIYWRPLEGLWSKIVVMFEKQITKIQALPFAFQGTVPDVLSDDQLIRKKRDEEGLEEPIAMSLLQFSYQRMRRKLAVDAEASASRRLDALIEPSSSPSVPLEVDFHQQSSIMPSPPEEQTTSTQNYTSMNAGTESHAVADGVALNRDVNLGIDDIDWTEDLSAFDPSLLLYMDFTEDTFAL